MNIELTESEIFTIRETLLHAELNNDYPKELKEKISLNGKSIREKFELAEFDITPHELELAKNLMITAFEGGSNYWYMIDSHNKNEIKECEFLSQLLSHKDGWMVISDAEESDGFPTKKVTFEDVVKAWHEFKTNNEYVHHYSDAIRECDDAVTGDVFLQLVVIGKVIFG